MIYIEGWPGNVHTIYPGRDNSWVTAGATRGLHGQIHTSRGENLINAVIYTKGWPENIHTIYPGKDSSWVTAGATRGLHGPTTHIPRRKPYQRCDLYRGMAGKSPEKTPPITIGFKIQILAS
ncbi:MAG TPA: hypothetical protein VKM36_09625 [Balneolaceae bacterium]|nr:hypothetical protein [Balneolaceae bacterium]